jgi:hypothetical protein
VEDGEPVTVAEELDAFVVTHKGHGPLHSDCGPVTGDGYTAWATCFGCGASWVRWVTLAMVEAEEQAGDSGLT